MIETPLSSPPAAEESERAIISSVLLDEAVAAEALAYLTPSDFHRDDCRRLWMLARGVQAKGQPLTLISLAEANCETVDSLEQKLTIANIVDVAEYRGPLVQGMPSAWKWHADRIRETARKRKLMYVARDFERMAMNGVSSAEAMSFAEEALRVLREESQGVAKDLESFTSAELDAMECEDCYLIDGLLVKGQPGVIGGPKKACKTTLSIDLNISLATGAKVFGQFYVNGAYKTALISGESGRATIQETARRIAKAKGWSLSLVEDCHWSFDLPTITVDSELLQLKRYVEKNGLQVLLLDPLYLALDIEDQAGNLFAMGKRLKPLSKLAADYGLTLLLNVHSKKGRANPFEPLELEDIAWAGIQEWARQWLLISRREAYDPDRGGSHKLWLTVGGSAGHSGCWGVDIEEGTRQDQGGRRWDIEVVAASQARAAAAERAEGERELKQRVKRNAKDYSDRKKVLDALKKFPDGETGRQISREAHVSGAAFKNVVDDLLTEGVIEGVELTKNGRKEKGIKLGATDGCRGATGAPVAAWCDNPPIGGVATAHRTDDTGTLEDFVAPEAFDE